MSDQPAPTPKAAERGPTEQLYPAIRYFAYEHLPPHLQAVSRPFAELAVMMVFECEPGPEVSAGLRKLLEAKDCFVRAALPARAAAPARPEPSNPPPPRSEQ